MKTIEVVAAVIKEEKKYLSHHLWDFFWRVKPKCP